MDENSEYQTDKIACPICEKNTPADMNFCIECDEQMKCLNCGSRLFKGKKYCLKCGKSILNKQENDGAPNYFVRKVEGEGPTYKEHTELRTTDNAVEIFAPLVFPQGSKQTTKPPNINQTIETAFEDVSNKLLEGAKNRTIDEISDQPHIDKSPIPSTNHSSISSNQITSLFEETQSGWILNNSELKASSKNDFVKRLTSLFIQYRHDKGQANVSRTEIMDILKYYGVYDGNVRQWLSGEKTLLHVTAKDIRLIGPGIQYVNDILKQLSDSEIPNGWKIGTKRKVGARGPYKKENETHD